MTVRIEAFPAGYGDSLLVSYGDESAPTRLLIDGGLAGCATTVLRRLEELDAHVDLFVITHVDADHIAGALRLLSRRAFTDRLGAVWFNGRIHLEQYNDLLGPLDGERVGALLADLTVPWNAGWAWRRRPDDLRADVGGPVAVTDGPRRVPLPGGATAVLLSPSTAELVALLPVWRAAIKAAGLVEGVPVAHDSPDPPTRTLLGEPTLDDLARTRTTEDDKEANGSSIAFVLEVPDAERTHRILLTGDAHPGLLAAGLTQLRDGDDPYRIDVCKLPHHGSRRNVTRELVASMTCRKWIVSTNGRLFHHPNAEALARIIVTHPGSTIYGNYLANEYLSAFVTTYPPERHDYSIVRPDTNAEGIVLTTDD